MQLTTRPLTPYRLTTPCASPRVDLKRPGDAAALAVSVLCNDLRHLISQSTQGDVAQFNEAQLKRMQLLATATPEFMNFSHFVLESCLVCDNIFRSSITCCAITIRSRISGPFQFAICAEAAMDEWSWAAPPPAAESQRSQGSNKSKKVGGAGDR